MQTIDVEIRPRRQFRAFLESTKRWYVLVAHRRAGKTVAVVQKLIKEALTHQRKGPPLRYGYIAPTRDQAKDIAWQYLKDYTADIPGAVPNEAELRIVFGNKAQIRLYSGENYERMRGLYFDGIVSDEDADIPPAAYTFVVLPCLLDYEGWHCRIGTPKGRNAFYHAYQRAATSEDHFAMLLKASESGILDADSLSEIRAEIGETAYAQEMECDFHISRPGAIYGRQIDEALAAGRISESVEWYKGLPVYTAWDIGAAVNTKCWVFQVVGDSINYLESLTGGAADMQDPGDWARELKKRQYAYGGHFLPHDGEVLWQRMLSQAGLSGVVCIPKCVMIWDPINDAKASFSRCRFNVTGCAEGLQALESYHSKEERDGITIKDVPVHDWCLAYGTQVLTPSGWRAVQEIAVHDEVLTPGGSRVVIRSGAVRLTNQWTTIKGIRCTPEHRFFTNRGLVQAGELSSLDRLWTQNSLALSILAFFSVIFRFGFKAATTLVIPEKEEHGEDRFCYIVWFMRLFTARYRKVTRFITSMIIRSTTILKTCQPCLDLSTEVNTSQSRGMNVFAVFAGKRSGVTSDLGRGAARIAGERIMQKSSVNGERAPAYNLTVAVDECYFVRGNDGRAYLVSNSSHYSSAFACSHQAIRAGMLVDRSAIPEEPDDWRRPEDQVIAGFTGPSHLRNIR